MDNDKNASSRVSEAEPVKVNKDAGVWAWIPIAAYLALLTLGTIATTFFTPEPRGRNLDDLRDAIAVK